MTARCRSVDAPGEKQETGGKRGATAERYERGRRGSVFLRRWVSRTAREGAYEAAKFHGRKLLPDLFYLIQGPQVANLELGSRRWAPAKGQVCFAIWRR